MAKTLDRMKLIERLARIQREKSEDRKHENLDSMGFAASLLALAGIDHEREYTLCRSLAERLLGKVPEPDDDELGEA